MRMMPDEDDGHNEDVANYNVKTPTCARGCRGRQAYWCADYCSLAACLSVFMSFFMSDCLFCQSVLSSSCQSAGLSSCHSVSACFAACLSVRWSFYLYFSPSVFLPVSLSACRFLSVSSSVRHAILSGTDKLDACCSFASTPVPSIHGHVTSQLAS